jgi:acetyl-CoA hydrolase
LHDLFEPADPPVRQEIPIYHASDRIGSPIAVVDPSKIVGVVLTAEDEETKEFSQPTAITEKIGQNVAEFLSSELRAGRIPKSFLPLQSGVGDVANSVLAALGADTSVPPFEMYTEVLQNSVVPLIENGRCKFASTCSLTVSPEAMQHIAGNIEFFKKHIVLRPQELSNNPEIVRRLGVISMNTAIEFDLGGNVNSTHVMGNMMMNGIGGSGDFTRAAYMSIFSCASTAKGGKISTVVPLASHIDHTEHSVSVVITEQGIADLRGKDPHERAQLIIENCAHPDFKDDLRKYLHLTKQGHVPQSMTLAFAMHRQFLSTGDMHHADWGDQTK